MSTNLANAFAYKVLGNGGARVGRIALGLLTMALSIGLIVPACAAVFPYDLLIRSFDSDTNPFDHNSNPAVFGSGGHTTVFFDNGNSTNQNQIYTYADIVNVTATSVGGTFTMTAEEPKTITFTGNSSDQYATTDAQGNLILPPPFVEFNVDNDATIFTGIDGDEVSVSAWFWSGTHQSRRTAAGDSALGALSLVPEPAAWSIALVGLAGLRLNPGQRRRGRR